jgi:MFS family permease
LQTSAYGWLRAGVHRVRLSATDARLALYVLPWHRAGSPGLFILRYIPEGRHFLESSSSAWQRATALNSSAFWDTLRRYPKEVAGVIRVDDLVLLERFRGVRRHLPGSGTGRRDTRGTWLSIWWFVAIFATSGGGLLAQRFGRKWTNVILVMLVVPLYATYGLWTDQTALFVIGLVMTSLFLAPFGQGTWGWVMELFPTECRATGFSLANFISGVTSIFYALIPAALGSVAASFPDLAAGYGLLAVAFLLLKETIRDELIEMVGERAGEARAATGLASDREERSLAALFDGTQPAAPRAGPP